MAANKAAAKKAREEREAAQNEDSGEEDSGWAPGHSVQDQQCRVRKLSIRVAFLATGYGLSFVLSSMQRVREFLGAVAGLRAPTHFV